MPLTASAAADLRARYAEYMAELEATDDDIVELFNVVEELVQAQQPLESIEIVPIALPLAQRMYADLTAPPGVATAPSQSPPFGLARRSAPPAAPAPAPTDDATNSGDSGATDADADTTTNNAALQDDDATSDRDAQTEAFELITEVKQLLNLLTADAIARIRQIFARNPKLKEAVKDLGEQLARAGVAVSADQPTVYDVGSLAPSVATRKAPERGTAER